MDLRSVSGPKESERGCSAAAVAKRTLNGAHRNSAALTKAKSM
jgi:hypothetical protein